MSEEAQAWSLPLAQAAASGAERLWVNVPARPSHRFVGRAQVLSELVDLLTMSRRPAAAVSGLVGAGKTALAVELANDPQITARFTGGVLWGGLGAQPDPATVLNQWAAALNLELADLPDLRQRGRRLSAAIGERKVLVVLDDAWDPEPPELLRLGAPNVVHLLTTRSLEIAETFAGADMAIVLPVLDDDPGFALLESLAPKACIAAPAAARGLVQKVGNLPLAIVMLGGYLRSSGAKHFASQRAQAISQAGDPATRLALATKRLGAETGGLVTLADIVGLSLHGLPEAVQQAFHALGAFAAKPARFDLDAALAVTGADEDALGALIDRNLVEIDEDEQMALHQVVADAACAKMPPEAVVRHGAHYLEVVDSNREDWQRIEAVYQQARHALEQLPPDDERLIPWVWTLRIYWERRGLGQEHRRWAQQALAVARAAGDSGAQGTLLNNIGGVYSALGEKQEALAYYEQALPLRRQVGDRSGEATTLNNIGVVYSALGEKQEALAYYEQALPLQAAGGRPVGRGDDAQQHRRGVLRAGREAGGAGVLRAGAAAAAGRWATGRARRRRSTTSAWCTLRWARSRRRWRTTSRRCR